MKNKIIVYGLALVVVINITALLTFAYHRWVQPYMKSTDFRAADSSVSFERRLCLSSDQSNCLRELMASYDAEIKDIQAQMKEKRRALVEEMKKETPDMASLDKLVEEISRLQAEIQKKAVLNIFKEKNILTPEQKERFFRLLENHVCPKEHGQRPSVEMHQDCINSH